MIFGGKISSIFRRKGRVKEFVSIYLHETQRSVNISSDGGRVCRPLIIVGDDGQPMVTEKHIKVTKFY